MNARLDNVWKTAQLCHTSWVEKCPATCSSKPEKAVKAKAEDTQETQSNSVLVKVGRAAMKRHGVKEVYVTSDGQVFAQKGNANAHARNLENKEVITVK